MLSRHATSVDDLTLQNFMSFERVKQIMREKKNHFYDIIL